MICIFQNSNMLRKMFFGFLDLTGIFHHFNGCFFLQSLDVLSSSLERLFSCDGICLVTGPENCNFGIIEVFCFLFLMPMVRDESIRLRKPSNIYCGMVLGPIKAFLDGEFFS